MNEHPVWTFAGAEKQWLKDLSDRVRATPEICYIADRLMAAVPPVAAAG